MEKLTKYKLNYLYEMGSGISTNKEDSGNGFPFVSFSTIFNNIFLPSKLNDLMNTSVEQRETSSVKKGDVLITRTSETLDELAMSCVALKDYPNTTFTGFAKRLRPLHPHLTYPKYMGFYFRSNYFRKLINVNTTMTLRASFNERVFSFLDVYLPDYHIQKKIGDMLYLIEEKIRINNQINDNLQQLGRILFDMWFHQFDFPSNISNKYKSNGGTMKWDRELKRYIPEKWEVLSIRELVNRKSILSEILDNLPVIDLSVMKSDSITLDRLNISNNFTTNMFKMKEGDILFGSIRPYLHKAGIAPCNGLVAGTIYSYTPKRKYDYNTVMFTLTSNNVFNYAVKVATGTKMPVVNSDNLLDYKLAYSTEVSKMFSTINFEQIIVNNVKENIKLMELRDYLIPILMNGQIKV